VLGSVKLDELDNISDHWPAATPPKRRHLQIIVELPDSKKRNITPTGLTLGIEEIDKEINKELDSLRGMVETFLKNPEPPTWIPPNSATPSNREFLTNLRIPSYHNGNPSLLFHNFDVCNDKEIEEIFGPGAHQYVVINCAMNTSQHVRVGAFATHPARAKPVACWKDSRNTGDSTLLQLQMSPELASEI
jgi:hypothetical protein